MLRWRFVLHLLGRGDAEDGEAAGERVLYGFYNSKRARGYRIVNNEAFRRIPRIKTCGQFGKVGNDMMRLELFPRPRDHFGKVNNESLERRRACRLGISDVRLCGLTQK